MRRWIKAIRAPFFTASLVPVVVGTSLAYLHTGTVNLVYALLCLTGLISLHASVNLLNDYGDHITGNDWYNKNISPFNAGSRSIQNGELTPREVLIGGIITLILGSLAGLYLNYVSHGNVILILGLIGVFSVLFYTLGPLRLGYRGVGELMVGVNFGILSVLGAYYLQANKITLPAILAGIPVALLITAVLYINEFPDHYADKMADKRTLIVILGPDKARVGFYIIIIGTYVSIFLPAILGEFTTLSLISLITIPLAIKITLHLRRYYDKFPDIIPANARTVQLHLITGLLLGLSFITTRLL
ncbi:MAG: 1,4-dihydroxy-2-naphthoate octaprenyltransferase [Candidatus Coatesbacteria bacterium 4484_99]|uniref:1,4-dihydroxy-2-naphthoate octaprenyltransferase n=1 Tax=Candidatus Coatesbacteria bacterium 4484_99 TaxID=1970774 RepID=A0A1W9S1Z7_9BACT|nr:MAG: 1,4-dihydroxy-2-naphthoate octaprenyltransferase [Candidatus Coatesbacteria bacterium 4484_99]RLC42488.1 MAG: 1,4-dihydroxy-2-naphthoate octaprenyltransferase [Candidatus Coatesbacteria bacterium]RLC44098.1 MAG: 1,4-dihydroxy-2-naphthoate octaprenyltransferase [Candidatus Coatesbacteria bacterium]